MFSFCRDFPPTLQIGTKNIAATDTICQLACAHQGYCLQNKWDPCCLQLRAPSLWLILGNWLFIKLVFHIGVIISHSFQKLKMGWAFSYKWTRGLSGSILPPAHHLPGRRALGVSWLYSRCDKIPKINSFQLGMVYLGSWVQSFGPWLCSPIAWDLWQSHASGGSA